MEKGGSGRSLHHCHHQKLANGSCIVAVLLNSIEITQALEHLRKTLDDDDHRHCQQRDQGEGGERLGCKQRLILPEDGDDHIDSKGDDGCKVYRCKCYRSRSSVRGRDQELTSGSWAGVVAQNDLHSNIKATNDFLKDLDVLISSARSPWGTGSMTRESPSILTAFISPSIAEVTRRRSWTFSIQRRCLPPKEDDNFDVIAMNAGISHISSNVLVCFIRTFGETH